MGMCIKTSGNNGYLKLFLGPDLNSPFVDDEIISILVAMIQTVWCRKMVSVYFEPLSKSLMEVIGYFELLEVL